MPETCRSLTPHASSTKHHSTRHSTTHQQGSTPATTQGAREGGGRSQRKHHSISTGLRTCITFNAGLVAPNHCMVLTFTQLDLATAACDSLVKSRIPNALTLGHQPCRAHQPPGPAPGGCGNRMPGTVSTGHTQLVGEPANTWVLLSDTCWYDLSRQQQSAGSKNQNMPRAMSCLLTLRAHSPRSRLYIAMKIQH